MDIKDSIKKLMAVTNKHVTEDELDAFVKHMSEQPKSEDDWEDGIAMLKDARKHANANSRKVVTNDKPTLLRIGFKCEETGKTWSIKISNLKRSLAILETDSEDIKTGKNALKDCLISAEGRMRMVQFINSNLSYEAFGLLK